MESYHGGSTYGTSVRRRTGKVPSSYRVAGRGYVESRAEAKRRKRVAKYKSYERERKIKAVIKKGYHWLKRKIEMIAHSF